MSDSNALLKMMQDWLEISMRRSMRSFFQYARTRGLSFSQFNAMFNLKRHGACGVSDIGDGLGVTRAAASQLVDRLVQQGLVSRTEDEVDRRLKKVVLTEKGLHLLHESLRARQNWLADLASSLSPEEQEQVIAALNILTEKARQLDAPPDFDL